MNLHTDLAYRVIQEVKKVVIGKDDCIQKVMAVILAKGHVLMEDIPGVGKTTMAMAFSKAMGLSSNRVQFTPDILPADVIGFSMYQKEMNQFFYHPGPIMCNLFLADEINRTSPKTQSALLEVMEEGKVTIDGIVHEVPSPFTVIATQNPLGSAGTQLLPESQLDRFMSCIQMGYPKLDDELAIVKGRISKATLEDVQSVLPPYELSALQKEVEGIYIHDTIYEYIGSIITATRNHTLVELGVSPRGTIALARMTQANAYLHGRTHALPEDAEEMAKDVCCHRIRLNSHARVNHTTTLEVLDDILHSIPRPTVRRK